MKTRSQQMISQGELCETLNVIDKGTRGRVLENEKKHDDHDLAHERLLQHKFPASHELATVIVPIPGRDFLESAYDWIAKIGGNREKSFYWSTENGYQLFVGADSIKKSKSILKKFGTKFQIESITTKVFPILESYKVFEMIRKADYVGLKLFQRKFDQLVRTDGIHFSLKPEESLSEIAEFFLNESTLDELSDLPEIPSLLVASEIVRERNKSPFINWIDVRNRINSLSHEQIDTVKAAGIALTSKKSYNKLMGTFFPVAIISATAFSGDRINILSPTSYQDPRLNLRYINDMIEQRLLQQDSEDEEDEICAMGVCVNTATEIGGMFVGVEVPNCMMSDDSDMLEDNRKINLNIAETNPCLGRVVSFIQNGQTYKIGKATATSGDDGLALTAAHVSGGSGQQIDHHFFQPSYNGEDIERGLPLPRDPKKFLEFSPQSCPVRRVRASQKWNERLSCKNTFRYCESFADFDYGMLQYTPKSYVPRNWDFCTETSEIDSKTATNHDIYFEGYGFKIPNNITKADYPLHPDGFEMKISSDMDFDCQYVTSSTSRFHRIKGRGRKHAISDHYLIPGHSGSFGYLSNSDAEYAIDNATKRRKVVAIHSGMRHVRDERYPEETYHCLITSAVVKEIDTWIVEAKQHFEHDFAMK